MSCRACGTKLTPFMSFGRMPVANNFAAPDDDRADAYRFELTPASCGNCGMFQLANVPDPARTVSTATPTSRLMERHFAELAATVRAGPLKTRRNPFVVELGSNDGVLLRNFAQAGVRHLGIEPSTPAATAARRLSVQTLNAAFSKETARTIRQNYGPADVILAVNVLSHIADISSVAAGVDHLLADDGVLVFEDPYLGDVIEKTAYDQIYDERVFLFHIASVRALFAPIGLTLIDVKPQKTHGGSMRYTFGRRGRQTTLPNVGAQERQEAALGLERAETYDKFRQKAEASRDALVNMLNCLTTQGKRIVGYGATPNSTTVLNYCGIGRDLVEFVVDGSPLKHGRVTPGSHLPVRPYDAFAAAKPDFALLFAWPHVVEIMAKEQAFIAGGGRFIMYVPSVGVLGGP